MLHNFINLDKWNALPPAYKSLMRTASSMANEWMQAKYDAANPAALKRLPRCARRSTSMRKCLGQMPTSRRCGKRCSPSATTNIFGGRSPS
jgi:TRAP-type mannitol/chloroaromatic compound transport system substrate-binding protein